ncbi:MAG: hypothetical protein A2X64_00105 [Ignavibacteria bacterium GWF2_33_9]|nr:MAG: hypothetical protein A2X64_00105 [Ignavibacteria bacterium GWF2_33_9]
MQLSNIERLIKIAEDTFDFRNDDSQLNVTPEIIEQLQKIHPAAMSEETNENGPIAWLLVIPTNEDLMKKFLANEINERELFELTPLNIKYDSIYLCSALVLDEYRKKGITKGLALNAIKKIQQNHPIKSLFVWTFSREGELAAESIARSTGLELFRK